MWKDKTSQKSLNTIRVHLLVVINAGLQHEFHSSDNFQHLKYECDHQGPAL